MLVKRKPIVPEIQCSVVTGAQYKRAVCIHLIEMILGGGRRALHIADAIFIVYHNIDLIKALSFFGDHLDNATLTPCSIQGGSCRTLYNFNRFDILWIQV